MAAAGGAAAAAVPQSPRAAFLLLVLAVACFGTAWPIAKYGLAEATPVWYAAGRAGLGAIAAFTLLAALGRLRLPGRRDLPVVLSVGLFQLTAFFAFTNLGLSLVPAGRSIVIAYTTTLWLVPLALLAGDRVGPRRLAGVAVGLAGVAVLCNPLALDWHARGVLLGHGALLLAALSWALAIFHVRRHVWRLSPFELLPWQFLLASLLLTPSALLLEPSGGIALSARALVPLFYVGVVAGPVATWAATSVARVLPTLVTSLGFLGVPALGMLLSTLWLGETLTPSLAAGAALVFVGLVLVARSNAGG